MQVLELSTKWQVFQDVKDKGEKFGVFTPGWSARKTQLEAFSDWEPIDRLAHLQLLMAQNPYYGRNLRSFNNAPWWYKNEFIVPDEAAGKRSVLRFEGVDYFCKVWLNGSLLGEHEGYFASFDFEVTDKLLFNGLNTLVVKVWSPWDTTNISLKSDGMAIDMSAHDMVKGTYEHSDGFIQRDVNPVGIWKKARLLMTSGAFVDGDLHIETDLQRGQECANVKVKAHLFSEQDRSVLVRCLIIDQSTNAAIAQTESIVVLPSEGLEYTAEF